MGRPRWYYERSWNKLRINRNSTTNNTENIIPFFKFLYNIKFSINAILNAKILSIFKKSFRKFVINL